MEDYRKYTKPAELQKAVNTLKGLVSGISADGNIRATEMDELTHWCLLHDNLRKQKPFSEVIDLLEKALADGVIDSEEKADILWLCGHLTNHTEYYDDITSSIQYVSGLVQGLIADGELTDAEIYALNSWLKESDFLRGTYPFDELNSIVRSILADDRITEDERNILMAFLSNLVDFNDSYNLTEPDFAKLREKYTVGGICALDPNIEVEGHTFCITGDSYRCDRDKFCQTVESYGGVMRSSVSKKTDYLLVGNAGSPCWAYSCYGRKIERAIELRKTGCKVQIVNEKDFWKAIDKE